MNIRRIRRAVGLVVKSSLSELHFEDAMGMTLIVRNHPQPGMAAAAHAAMGVEPDVAAAAPAGAPRSGLPCAAPTRIVASPMVGRFYRGARHDGVPLSTVGEKIEAGQAVGSVEVMRLMYAIRSDFAGTIESVLVEEGEAVEYGQPLVRIT
ncbi:acetyl-CoA carboxylase biotin carboxyl carrier protein [Paraburkholderia diazotrophica]|uniref:Biotin carboxyl carrier protein of acetyl-CoA carboxylase n=1 Tax=Paraburkholderia diazotrophica TaxID=667676 RepID=A0A1H6VIR5_9BURK|nr:biotin/lipoyl-containing protein [Paraburkholderia diazotrophica]SEJ02834.1 acetyl-CoA carboxylase biotin carboxyl carrier protein [Paraburkholderia diazotrophica]